MFSEIRFIVTKRNKYSIINVIRYGNVKAKFFALNVLAIEQVEVFYDFFIASAIQLAQDNMLR